MNLHKKKLKIINQIHSNEVVLIDKDNFNNKFEGDGIITQDKNISIAILTADCCPIFLFDDDCTFISCLHAGWKGCYSNIVEKALTKIKKLQPDTTKIKAVIGPCLDKKNFEVDDEFKHKFIKKKQSYEGFFQTSKKKGKFLFNMRNMINSQILKNNINIIENIDFDTYSNPDLFFSHRRSTHLDLNPAGRMINIIGFNS